MHEPLVEMVAGRPQTRLVAGCTGYRIEGTEPGVRRILPFRHLTFIVTSPLSATADQMAVASSTT